MWESRLYPASNWRKELRKAHLKARADFLTSLRRKARKGSP